MRHWLSCAAFLLLPSPLLAAELRDVRLWASPDSTRVVFDLDHEAEHKLYTLSNPDRIVIDLSGAHPAPTFQPPADGKGFVQRLRTGDRTDGLRVVLDVAQPVVPKSFSILPNADYGFRVVVDLGVTAASAPAGSPAPTSVTPAQPAVERPLIVAVDAGHGGEDPGTRGPKGVLEKDVALSMARKLAKLINSEKGMKAVLIRDGDYYVGLKDRVAKARDAQADLFVSIHCNSYKDRRMEGTAVYMLSQRGASSSQAKFLAEKENDSDLIGGVNLQDKDDTLAAVLVDISQTSAIEASFDLGSRLLGSMGKVHSLQKHEVQQAAFAVLKAPDIPSVLVETAFLSNPREEKLLADSDQQDKLARSMLDGIKGYFSTYRPAGQQMAGLQGATQ